MTSDLAEFLLARYAEAEANAVNIHDTYACDSIPCNCGVPEAIRAGCEAKRRIVKLHASRESRAVYTQSEHLVCQACAAGDEYEGFWADDWPCETLRLLALPYAGHPDYRQEWKP